MTKSDEPDAPGLRRIASWETDPRYSPNPTNGIVEVTCPNCSKVYHAHCTHLGTAFDCKACGVRFVGKTNEAGVQKITVHYWGRAL
ncbi:MAG TPA: hypothetical protein VGE52_11950, partial [Pirellulales bacterium]